MRNELKREAQNRSHKLCLCSGMCFSNFHVPANYLGSSLEGRFGFSISKKLPRDAKDAGPHFWVSREHVKVSLLRGGW